MTARRIFWTPPTMTTQVGEYACEITYCPTMKRARRCYWRIDKPGVDHASRFGRFGRVASESAAKRHVRAALIERGLELVWGGR